MSSFSASANGQPNHRSQGRCCGGWGKGANWSGINIAAMVVGFVLFWPVGLFVLYWIVTGRDVRELPQWIHHQWSRITGMCSRDEGVSKDGRSDNVVFNEFQQTQHDRIREIREEIRERSRRFAQFRATAKRRADEEEFNRFMADAPGTRDV